jgi:hypothetical protein
MSEIGSFPLGTRRTLGENLPVPPASLGGIIAHFVLLPRAFWDDDPAIFKREDTTPLVTLSPPTSNIYRFSPDSNLFIRFRGMMNPPQVIHFRDLLLRTSPQFNLVINSTG